MIKYAAIIISFFCVQLLPAQDIEYKDYSLSASPIYQDSLSVVGEVSTIVLKDKDVVEFAFEDGRLYEYILSHMRMRLLTDKSIEGNNKVYIPLGPGDELLKSEARVITSTGKVIALGKDAIKEGEDEDSHYKYKYFAFEGVEIGSEVEYFYLIKRSPRYEGRSHRFQSSSPRFDVSFEVISPWSLSFAFKTYNGLPKEMSVDTTLEKKNKWVIKLDTVAQFKHQESAFDGANELYLIYKIDKNLYNGSSDIISYGEISQRLYENVAMYSEKDKKSEKKVISKIAKEIKLSGTDTESKVRMIENFLKKNYKFIDVPFEQFKTLSYIYENKSYNELGAMRLFSLLLSYFEIKYEIMLTSDRTRLPFDKEFEAYNLLQEYFLYFPQLGLYLDPDNPFYRLGYISPEYMNTFGLFIKPVEVGDFITGVGKVKEIKGLDKDKTTSNIYVDVTIDAEFSEPQYKISHESTGYYAYSFQPIYDLIKEEEKKIELSKAAIEYIDKEGEINDLKVENAGGEFFGSKPFKVSATLDTEKFFESAGTKSLFKLGELIGPQMEMYQEEKRVLPIQSDYNRSYHREITFNIPEGYKVTNLSDINIKETHSSVKDDDLAFVSSYTREGNKIKVVVDEYYDTMDLPVSEFADYQRVINAAANFNKVVLIFEEK